MYTKHGHHISGTPLDEENKPSSVARCGGPGMCSKCSTEAEGVRMLVAEEADMRTGVLTKTIKRNTVQDQILDIVYTYVKSKLEKTDTHITFGADEVYVVWFCYILGSYKALVSTTLPDGMYYEVTYNNCKGEYYLDAYKKFDNIKIRDSDLLKG